MWEFKRFQHNKVLIKKVGGTPVKVLAGSTNFSITGLYVNANHVVVFDNAKVAVQYETAFDAALKDELGAPKFYSDEISMKEFPINESGTPIATFSPMASRTPWIPKTTLSTVRRFTHRLQRAENLYTRRRTPRPFLYHLRGSAR